MANKEFKISILLSATSKKLTEGLRKSSKAFANASKSAAKLGNTLKTKLGRGMTAATTGMRKFTAGLRSEISSVVPMRVGFLALGGAIVNASMKFNKLMANVATLIPKNQPRVLELKEGVQEMAMEIGKSTEDLSSGLYQVISAFGDSSEAMAQLEINAKAATAGMATTTEAINHTSAVTKGYGNTSAEAMKKAADLAFLTVKLGQTTFPELAASIGRTIPFAAKLKVSQEELFATFATLTGVTGNASEVSTQMAAVLKAMLKPTTGMKKAVKALGYESAAAMVKEKGMTEALRLLMEQTGGTETEVAKLFGRAEALTAVFALTGESTKDLDKKFAAMKESTGAMNIAFEEVTGGVNEAGHEWEKFKATLSVTAQAVGDIVLPVLSKLLKLVGALAKGVKELFSAKTWKGIGSSILAIPKLQKGAAATAAVKGIEAIPEAERTESQKAILKRSKVAGREALPELQAELKRLESRKFLEGIAGTGITSAIRRKELEEQIKVLGGETKSEITLKVLSDNKVVVDKMKDKKGKSNIKVFTGGYLSSVAAR